MKGLQPRNGQDVRRAVDLFRRVEARLVRDLREIQVTAFLDQPEACSLQQVLAGVDGADGDELLAGLALLAAQRQNRGQERRLVMTELVWAIAEAARAGGMSRHLIATA